MSLWWMDSPEPGSVTLNMETAYFSVTLKQTLLRMHNSGKVPEDHHLSKICRGKINIVGENVICLRIPHGS